MNDSQLIRNPKSMSDQIYEILKAKILKNEIEAGARLMQEEIARSFNTSRTPIRQAFYLLEKDGLVERIPQEGYQVTHVDYKTVKEVYGIRQVLEVYAIELACENISPESLNLLMATRNNANEILQSKSIEKEDKLQRLLDLNSNFHETIYNLTENNHLIAILYYLRNIIIRLRAMGLREENAWRQAWNEHSDLINFLKEKNKGAAKKLMKKHILKAATDVKTSFKDDKRHKVELQ